MLTCLKINKSDKMLWFITLPMIGFESFCNRVQNKGNAGRVGQQFSQLRAKKT
jgi:hypothetical protein